MFKKNLFSRRGTVAGRRRFTGRPARRTPLLLPSRASRALTRGPPKPRVISFCASLARLRAGRTGSQVREPAGLNTVKVYGLPRSSDRGTVAGLELSCQPRICSSVPEPDMAPRPNWKGYLKLSLVSCPVALYPATTTSERVSFRTLNRDTGNRVRRQFVDEQTGEPVESENQAKGYEVGKGEYIVLEDDELKSVQIESNHTIDIERFVPRAEIDELYLDTPYYLAPTDRVGEEAFAVIREAMRDGEDGGPGARRAVPPRAPDDARAARQGHRGDQPALRQRGARGQRLLRGDPRPRPAQGDAGARQAHHREDDGQVPAGRSSRTATRRP